MNTGELIKKYRKEKKITQKQLASLIGKAEITIRKYESGALVPPLETLYSIAKVLEIPVENLTKTKKVTFQAKMLCKAILNGFEISGLSKKDFCTKLDIKEDELERYIQGISIPPLKLIEKTCDLSDKSLNDLVHYKKENPNDTDTDYNTLSKLLEGFIDIFDTMGMKLRVYHTDILDPENDVLKVELKDTKNGYIKTFNGLKEAEQFLNGIKFMIQGAVDTLRYTDNKEGE
ncbi:helix-turn-helix domain-containing protein [Intestinibacter bartlettii]|jgi:transcriptional regulator with XRE-family HTH domain|uniref:Helix-turn-helix domain-containing protein n=1 Tax=Intestinibacter bartlettii TaxID=261299 RepID=A0ABS6E147_9FIRM|nr:helix-turn-helix transcriptional regulator [Intestinibacter bartlettii]MBU5337499.1 helix-turn-helix domain-containing protein [Intestinibacter bartlettii]